MFTACFWVPLCLITASPVQNNLVSDSVGRQDIFSLSNTDATDLDLQKHPHKSTQNTTKFGFRCVKVTHMHHITKIGCKILLVIIASGQC